MILPDVNGSTPTAFLENIRTDVDRLAAQVMAPQQASHILVGMLNLASAMMEELRTIREVADHVGSIAYAQAWWPCYRELPGRASCASAVLWHCGR
ncbi:hypothetical protein [Methylobacterium sp. 275MFSha3.1]|uniref:hypothetical protein n=1 Tax=Methylobacterium sp. 275MFSha3.1 TaxID=1502746 RepID=UPI00147EFCA8|nr:hypothetical protein [Methylobacterium sp. 275MFSha3.1]